jgi:hypothetical protein
MLDLAEMQSSIDRNGAKACSPAREHHFQELGAVLHAQHDAVAGCQTAGDETAGKRGDAMGELAVAPGVEIVADR